MYLKNAMYVVTVAGKSSSLLMRYFLRVQNRYKFEKCFGKKVEKIQEAMAS